MWLPLLLSVFALQTSGILGKVGEAPVILNQQEVIDKLATIREDQVPGAVITTVKASEVDNRTLTFSINDKTYFQIGYRSGEISLKSMWDYDNTKSDEERKLKLEITVTDEEQDKTIIYPEVRLINVNDNEPEFEDTLESDTIREDEQVGYTVMPVTVNDKDKSANDPLVVTCANRDDDTCEVFKLNVMRRNDDFWRGTITLNRPLDYEQKNSYAIRLNASDGLNTRIQEFQIKVKDVNDSPPRFVRAESKIIPEGDPVGTYIDYVSAIDSDQDDRRPIRYELIGDDEALRYFSVAKVGGNITNNVILDYEDPDRRPGQEFILKIKAMELLSSNPEVLGNNSMTTAEATITIALIDINDNCPTFDKEEYSLFILESIDSDTNIPVPLRLTDKDQIDQNRQFSLEMVDPSRTFDLDYVGQQAPASIYIKVINNENIDYESTKKTYQLTITARDRGNSACSTTTRVTIQVEDVNDERPEFEQTQYEVSVLENAPGGTSLISIRATDRDSNNYGTNGLVYSFLIPNDLFRIDPKSGVVTVNYCPTPGKKPCIDYEWEQSYSLSVVVKDNLGTNPTKQNSVELTIRIENVNDNAPEFLGNYTRYIQEGNTRTDSDLIVQAIDRDGNTVTYSLVRSRDADYWTINSATGEIVAIKPVKLSDTTDGKFTFSAKASDGEQESIARVTVIVLDINDNSPQFLKFADSVSIREDTGGDVFVREVTVTDADSPTSGNGQVDIAIETGSIGKFTVKNLRLEDPYFIADVYTQSDATFDFETQDQYVLTLKARDKGASPRTGTSTLTVNILDINNKDPYIDPPTVSEKVSENVAVGTSVVTVSAKDPDADSVLVFSFGSPIIARNPSGLEVTNPTLYENLFTITPGGVVRTNQPLDRDIVSAMEFPLIVIDTNANPQQTGTGSLFIRILEYNDQPPYFEQNFYNLSIEEERSKGSFVTSLLALDEDDEIASYRLIENPENLFSIDAETGTLTVNGRLDYEARHSVTLVAQALDSGTPQLTATTTVLINLININDNAPVFSKTIYEIDIPEHSTRTDPLISVFATDLDEGDFGVVRYSANDTYFTVDPFSGEVTLKPGANLDRETFSTHVFQVTAYDSPLNASVRLFTTTQVYVILADINDNCPVFKQDNSYSDTIIETADIGDQVLEMFATDEDFGYNHSIKFTIDSASAQPPDADDLFSILSVQSLTANIESGRIEVKNSLRGKKGTYSFTVVASDQNGENITGDMCSTRVNVTIRVEEAINDAPEWILPPSRNFSIDVLESQYLGMLVYDCQARDDDTGKEGIVGYSFLVEQTLRQTTAEFRINNVTGVISARIVFDREQVSSYVLTVVAKDQGNPAASSETVLIVNVLDVNDNDPEFPMRNGETIPYEFTVLEGATPDGVIGIVSATDRDSDHRNNKVFYRIMAGNDDGLFVLGRESGELRLSTRARNGLDREAKAAYFMDVLAYNDVNDDTVIRYRRRRSTNPSIVTVVVTVVDVNDTPPKFGKSDYYGCVSRDAPFGQSILTVEATDEDLNRARFLAYTKVRESTDSFFSVDQTLGIICNVKLLYDIDSRVPVLRIRVDDTAIEDGTRGNTAETDVKIFVTDTDNEVKLVIAQPSADVRYYQDQLVRAMINTSSPTPISYVCIREIRDHVDEDGGYSYTKTDVFLSAVYMDGGTYKIYDNDRLQDILVAELPKYQSLHVKSVVVESEEEDTLSLTEDSVLAIFIIAILLIFLALILFCLACCLIRNSKKKKMKKLRAEERRPVEVVMHQPAPEVGTNVNPVYDNRGFDDGNEYAVVQKKRPAPEAVAPPIIPVVVPAEEVEPTPEQPFEESEPVIITEPIMTEEEPAMLPPPEDFFTTEPEAVPTPPPEPEPVIETVIETEVVVDDPYNRPESPETSPEDEIEVEFGDIPDTPSPRRSPSPPSPEEGYRIETSVM